MTAKALNQPIREVYCPHCHLATRASSERCLHCGRTMLAGLSDETCVPKAAGGRAQFRAVEENGRFAGQRDFLMAARPRGSDSCLSA